MKVNCTLIQFWFPAFKIYLIIFKLVLQQFNWQLKFLGENN